MTRTTTNKNLQKSQAGGKCSKTASYYWKNYIYIEQKKVYNFEFFEIIP